MLNLNGTTTLFCLDGSGNMHRLDTTIRPLGPRSDLLMAAAGDQGMTIKNVAKLGEIPVHLYAAREPAVAAFIPRLCLRTYYMANGTGDQLCMVPHFIAENAVEFQNDWVPPEDCKLVFVYRRPNCYVLAIQVGGAKPVIRCLPLPNVYDDGRICMGNWAPGAEATLTGILKSAITFFSTSLWNSDLNGGTKRGMLAEFMRFTVDGKQMPPRHPWHNYSGAVASANYNWVVEALG